MANEKNLLKGKDTQFTSENQPENRGRKPSALRFIREQGLSITDIRKIIDSLIWGYDNKELEELLKTEKVKVEYIDEHGKKKTRTEIRPIEPLPMGVTLILGALNDDNRKRSLTNYKLLMEQVHGKPTQSVEMNATGTLTTVTLSQEERRRRIEELLGKCEPKKKKNKP